MLSLIVLLHLLLFAYEVHCTIVQLPRGSHVLYGTMGDEKQRSSTSRVKRSGIWLVGSRGWISPCGLCAGVLSPGGFWP
ncbi:hypothetical protein Y032_0087g2065 [Ancylostoma ceylanicum]|uniref:Secreted protein n=1 Tax=Ancylostoma ceylanicum TaxID=53326 RepID=A0A016TNJ4_9BILA|nr:hypothetical protein Y032_0087g2065 [Ancylostoma ceylanicum]